MVLLFYTRTLQYSALFRPTLPCLIPVRTAVLSYKIIGESSEPDQPPVFLLHDVLEAKKHWEGFGKTILNITKRQVVAIDLRNHGESPHFASHKYEELAADVTQLFEKLDVDKASLIGHSMGGRTSMCISLMHPKIVAGLLVVDISPVSTCSQFMNDFPKILKAMRTVDFKRAKKVSRARKEAKKQIRPSVSDDQIMRAVLSNVNIRPDGAIGWTCNLDVLMKHFEYIASFPSFAGKQYPGPALFIGGQKSEFLPPDDLPGIRELFPQAVVTYVPKTGHSVHVDNPKAFLELAIQFLKTNH